MAIEEWRTDWAQRGSRFIGNLLGHNKSKVQSVFNWKREAAVPQAGRIPERIHPLGHFRICARRFPPPPKKRVRNQLVLAMGLKEPLNGMGEPCEMQCGGGGIRTPILHSEHRLRRTVCLLFAPLPHSGERSSGTLPPFEMTNTHPKLYGLFPPCAGTATKSNK